MELNQETLKAVEQLKNGEQKGFSTLYSNTCHFVYSRARLVIKDEQEALDLMQEVYISAYKSIDSLKDVKSLYAWLGSITIRQGMKMLNKKKNQVLLSEEKESMFEEVPDENLNMEDELANQQDAEAIKQCISELSEEQRVAILAYYYDNLKVEEIAELSGVSAGTVKSRLYLARKSLKDSIEKLEKKQGYKLHSFGVPTLVIAISLLLEDADLSLETAQMIYNDVCSKIELPTTELNIPQKTLETQSTSPEFTGNKNTRRKSFMKENRFVEWIKKSKKNMAIVASSTVVGAGCIVGGVCWYVSAQNNDAVEASQTIEDVTTDVHISDVKNYYRKYIKGLKDWTVQAGQKVNFMDGVEWDKNFISTVTADSSKIDFKKEGTYSLVYTVKVKDSKEKDLRITKKVTVQVVSEAKAEEAVKAGEEVVTDKGIQNKQEAKPSSINDKGTMAKKVNTTSKPTVSTPATTPKKDNKPAETPKPNPPKEEKPAHVHSWQPQYRHHDAVKEDQGHYETVVDVPESQVWVPKIVYYTACRLCGEPCPNNDPGCDAAFGHIASVHNWDPQAGWKDCQRDDGHYETVPAKTHQEWVSNWVVVKEAYDEHIGDKCSCGATR